MMKMMMRTPGLITSSETGSISRRKSAPPPPSVEKSKSPVPAPRTMTGVATTPSPKPRLISAVSPSLPPFPSPSEKSHKDLSNLHLQCGVNKDSHGQVINDTSIISQKYILMSLFFIFIFPVEKKERSGSTSTVSPKTPTKEIAIERNPTGVGRH